MAVRLKPKPKAVPDIAPQTVAVDAVARLVDTVSNRAILMLDSNGIVTSWGAAAEDLFGWTAAEICGRGVEALFAPTVLCDLRTLLLRAARGEQIQADYAYCRKDGATFRAITAIAASDRIVGQDLGFRFVIRDVTAERALPSAIEANNTLLHAILKTVPSAMIVIDDRGRIQMFSATAEALFGYAEAEVIGRNVSMLMPSPDREAHDAHLLHYYNTGQAKVIGHKRRVLGVRKDGTTFAHELVVGETRDDGTRVFTGFIRDLTAREEADAKLAELQAELLHIARVSAMGTMASALAHELNQPLAAVAAYVETSIAVLRAGAADAAVVVERALTDAAGEAHRAGKIIRRLREFVARGRVDKAVEPLGAVIEDACTLGAIGAKNRGIEIERVVDPHCGSVLVDRIQIQQVLVNLLCNAVEASPPDCHGVIRIAARPLGEFAQVTVSDRGLGLAPEITPNLFGAFATSKPDGMGLGLSICRTIIEAHGGRIWAEPQPVGTAFHFTVPRTLEESRHD